MSSCLLLPCVAALAKESTRLKCYAQHFTESATFWLLSMVVERIHFEWRFLFVLSLISNCFVPIFFGKLFEVNWLHSFKLKIQFIFHSDFLLIPQLLHSGHFLYIYRCINSLNFFISHNVTKIVQQSCLWYYVWF